MEREQQDTPVVELGTASSETLGTPVGQRPEPIGFYALGLSDQ